MGGKSTQGVGFYSGPCTPPGSPHHYTFVVVATDFDVKELAPGLTREEFLAKLVPQGGTSHAKGSAGLVGLFVKPRITASAGRPRPGAWSHCQRGSRLPTAGYGRHGTTLMRKRRRLILFRVERALASHVPGERRTPVRI